MSETVEEMMRRLVREELNNLMSDQAFKGPKGDAGLNGEDGVMSKKEVKSAVKEGVEEVLDERDKAMAVVLEDFAEQVTNLVDVAMKKALDEKEKELMTKFRSMGRGGFVSGGFMDGNN